VDAWSDPRTPRSRKAAEHTSVFVRMHPPFAGRYRTGDLSGDASGVRARSIRPVRGASEKGSALPRRSSYDSEVCGPLRGGDSAVERLREPSLESARFGHASSFESVSCSARQPVPSPKGGGRRQRRWRFVTSYRRMRGIGALAVSAPCFARFAEVGRTSSRPEKRATGWTGVESLSPPRSP